MDITVVSTGRTFRRIDDGVGFLLMEAFPESFKRVDPRQQQPAPAPVVPGFFISKSPYTGAWLLNCRRVSGEVVGVSGEVVGYNDGAKRKQATNTLGAGEIPDALWEQFVAASELERQKVASGSSPNTRR
jgi:hypothetical protein